MGPHLVDSLISDEVRESEDSDLIAEARKQAVQRYIDMPLYCTIRLCIEYSLPETTLSEITSISVSQDNNKSMMTAINSSGK